MPDGSNPRSAATDTAAALDFLVKWVAGWEAGWFLTLCAIVPDGPTETRSWRSAEISSRTEDIAAWIKAVNQSGRNVYFTANPVRLAAAKKPSKSDIAAAAALVVDLDPPKDGRSFDQRRGQVERGIGKLLSKFKSPGAAIIASGNGVNVLARLQAPIIGGVQDFVPAEKASRVLSRILATESGLGADAVQNVDRLLRLPGTLNWPTAAKLARGYPQAPSLAQLIFLDVSGGLTPADIDQLITAYAENQRGRNGTDDATDAPTAGPALPLQSEQQKVDAVAAALLRQWREITAAGSRDDFDTAFRKRLDDAILLHRGLLRRWNGDAEGLRDSSRSGMVMALAGCLKAAGFDNLDAARVLWVYPYGDVADTTKHPNATAQARAIARALVRAMAEPTDEAERADRVRAVALDAAERALRAALPSAPELVREMLPVCVRADAEAEGVFARKAKDWAARARLSQGGLSRIRKMVLGAAEQARAAAAQREAAASRPTIELDAGLGAVVDAAEAALAGAVPPQLYRLGGKLVTVPERPDARLVGDENAAAPGFATAPATMNTVRLALARVAIFTRAGRMEEPPKDIAATIADRGAAVAVPMLRGIAAFPVLRPDGSIAVLPGYDAESRMLLAADWEGLSLPQAPSRDDARAALAALAEPFDQFPFDPEDGRSAFLAHVLHTLVRHLLPLVPGLVYAAPAPGSGKTLLATCPSLIAHGRPPALLAAISGTDDAEETRKRITGFLLSSRADILFDNQKRGGLFGNTALDALLTAPEWSDRLLGTSTTATLPNTAVVAVSGNNLRIGADTGRRVLFAYLDPRTPQPEARQGFRHPDLLGHVRRERPRLMAAALTVMRAHLLANRPLTGGCTAAPVLGSFEPWSRLVAAAIEFAGQPNPIATQRWGRERFDTADEDLGTLERFLEACAHVFGTARFTTRDVLDARSLPFDGPAGGAAMAATGSAPPDAASREALSAATAALLAGTRGDEGRALGAILARLAAQMTPGGWSLRARGTVNGAKTYAVVSPGGELA